MKKNDRYRCFKFFQQGDLWWGFGPIVTAGQIMAGQKHKAAIGATTLAEAPLCIASFFCLSYWENSDRNKSANNEYGR